VPPLFGVAGGAPTISPERITMTTSFRQPMSYKRLVGNAVDDTIWPHSQARHETLARGSIASRRPSPMKLMAITVTRIIKPGKMATQGACSITVWAL
jgi:hypothetical protein